MTDATTTFAYIGGRDYIHGTSVLSGFLEALEARGASDIAVKRLKFQRHARSNGRLRVATETLAEVDVAAANAVLTATAGGTTWRGLFTETGAIPTRRVSVSYAIGDLVADAFSGRCSISATDRDDLIRVLVEANKRFHEATLAPRVPVQVRFGYLENWIAPRRDVRVAGELRAANLIAKQSDEGWMTINRLTYLSAARPVSLTLCFHVADARGAG